MLLSRYLVFAGAVHPAPGSHDCHQSQAGSQTKSMVRGSAVHLGRSMKRAVMKSMPMLAAGSSMARAIGG